MMKILKNDCEGTTGLESEAFRPITNIDVHVGILNGLYEGDQQLLSVKKTDDGKITMLASTYLLGLTSGDAEHASEEIEAALKDTSAPEDLKQLLVGFDWSTSFAVGDFIELIMEAGQLIKVTTSDSEYGDSEFTIQKP